jgi:transcriptional regulator with XRE-family HTH domain
MTAKGLSQSDLARAAFGTLQTKEGYEVAKNRDRISVYLAGKALPDPGNLKALADVLGMTVEELAPPPAVPAAVREAPSLAMHAIPGQQGMVQLQINMRVSVALAAKIMALIGEHENKA